MEGIRIVLSILALVSYLPLVKGYGCDYVFPGTPTFGLNCQHRCHCVNDEKCTESEGCLNGRCEHGWMGPRCQYRNIAKYYKETAQEGENFIQHSDLAVDGNLLTCSETNLAQSDGQQAWRIQLDRKYRVVGVKIHILDNDLENFANFRIETGPTSLSFPNLCYENQNKPDTSVIEIMCLETAVTQNIRITQLSENVPLRICEFEIYGGREIAFNMPTNQSTNYGTWLAARAVDGRYTDEGEELVIEANTCSRTDGQENNPWLSVDLQQDFKIQDISFYGRHTTSDQSQGFYISVDDSVHDTHVIFHDDTVGTPDPADYSPRTTALATEYTANLVTIGMRPYSGTAALSVCELHIFADCAENKCGWTCERDCYCNGQLTGKMKIDGICPYGCSGRWTGENGACDTECSEKEWGEMCHRKCGNCSKFPCDLKTGQCNGGCSGPWLPPHCKQVCGKGTYGTDCLKRCGHCINGTTCDIETGYCLRGCDPGWQGDRCDTECPAHRFGVDCKQRCYCYDGADCSKSSGQCPGDCAPGYNGIYCDMVCPYGHYGLTCAHVCGKCRNDQTCDHINGRCKDGCKPGYEGALCKHEYNLIESIKGTAITSMSSVATGWDGKRAIDGDIGPDPNICHCCSSTENEAVSWWSIDLGKQYPLKSVEVFPRSNEKVFQQMQGFNLTFKNSTIEHGIVVHTNQQIVDTEPVIIDIPNIPAQIIEIRRIGKLTICEMMVREGDCSIGRYGDECELFCHCADRQPCDRSSGICATPVCDVGWTGNACNTECPEGQYGQHCAMRCGNCKHNTCHHETGKCYDGCAEGYTGCFCSEECQAGYFGRDCTSKCGKCKEGGKCDSITGVCYNGCETGYTEPLCNDQSTSGSAVMVFSICNLVWSLLLFV